MAYGGHPAVTNIDKLINGLRSSEEMIMIYGLVTENVGYIPNEIAI